MLHSQVNRGSAALWDLMSLMQLHLEKKCSTLHYYYNTDNFHFYHRLIFLNDKMMYENVQQRLHLLWKVQNRRQKNQFIRIFSS